MKNLSSEEAQIVWTIKEDSIHSSPFYISNTREQTFTLLPNAPGNRINMSSGIGTWSLKHVQNLVDDLESLEIRWKNGEIKLDTEEKIRDYLLSRRKGIGKDKIEIRIKD